MWPRSHLAFDYLLYSRWIHTESDLDETPETTQNYRVALRVFGRCVTDEGVDSANDIVPIYIGEANGITSRLHGHFKQHRDALRLRNHADPKNNE